MTNLQPRQAFDDETGFELKANADLPGMARLRINCLVSIPTGIRILAMIDAEASGNSDQADVSGE